MCQVCFNLGFSRPPTHTHTRQVNRAVSAELQPALQDALTATSPSRRSSQLSILHTRLATLVAEVEASLVPLQLERKPLTMLQVGG